MDRRQFIKDIFLWSAGASLAVPHFRILPSALAAEKPPALLSLARGEDYAALVAQVLAPLGGIENFVRPGDKVVIKPNIGWDRSPEQAANTHPLVVKALAAQALQAGAEKVLVFDRTCNEERRCYVNSGIEKAIRELDDKRVRIEHVDRRKFVPIKISRGKSLSEWEIYKDALDCDCYINVPVAKHHGLSRLTLGLKNSMGVLGGNRGSLHQNLGQNLADLATVIRPKLTVIDATRILLRSGPQGGDLKDVKKTDTLLASADPVAADAYATTLFDLKPDAIESTLAAYKMGLGEMDLDKIQVLTA
ncbi:MAG: cytoplasmic protein [Desulfobulbaceae bacterium DB1]|nr:MAG: cytoplasmic protein [Desulfobulbaceae bacterium DB1]